MRTTTLLFAGAVLAASPLVVSAEGSFAPPFTVGTGFAYGFADSERNSDNGYGFYVSGAMKLSEQFNLEISAEHLKFDSDAPADPALWFQNTFKLDGQFFYSRNPSFSPYVGIAAGYANNELRNLGGGDDDGTFLDVGGGFHTYPASFKRQVGFAFDARYRILNADIGTEDSLNEVVLHAGLVVPFGMKPTPIYVAAKPAPVEKEEPVAEIVTERKFDDVNFDFDQSTLTPTAMSILDSTASEVDTLSESAPKLRVQVDGHTDWIGTDGYNMGLGERRANAVKQYLIRKGIAADRIDTTSYGESKPIETNETAEGRAANRRAEVRTTGDE